MTELRTCRRCRVVLKEYATGGLCPRCLLRGGLGQTEAPGLQREAGGATSLAGRSFGDYELLEQIAHGGMGVVYRARQRSLDRIVAVKLLLAGQFAEPKFIQRFRAEAEAAARLQHPNIVAIHETGEQDGYQYFSMDYVAGKNLAQVRNEFGTRGVDFQRCARWVKQIAEAVHYAHQRGIIHRDLKPANVLIDEHDQPHITDFGLAKRLSSNSDFEHGTSDLTLTGQVLGSPNYLPPEQAAGKPAGVTSDVYSLGAILYHLLTGRPPFEAVSLTGVLKQVLETEPVSPRLLNPGIPHDLATIAQKCLEKEPARRYPTAQELADDVGRFLAGEPIRARPVGVVGQAWKWCCRRPAFAALGAALVLSLLAGFTAVLWQMQQTKESESVAQQNAYAADMNLAQVALENGDLGAAITLLEEHRPQRGQRDLRGWEWRYLWQRCRSDELFELTKCPQGIGLVASSPNGRWLAVQSKATLVLWDIGSRTQVCSFPMYGYLDPFVFSQRGDLLAYSAPAPPAVKVVDLRTRQEVGYFLQTTQVVQLAFSADATRLSVLVEDAGLIEWDLATKKALRSTKFPTDKFTANPHWLVFAPDGRTVAFRADHGLGLWEAASGRQIRLELTGTRDSPTALRFSPDGTLLAAGVGDADSEIYVWPVEDLWRSNKATPAPRHSFGKHRGWVCDIAFSPDGRALVSGIADSSLRVWQFDGQRASHQYHGHRHQVLSVAWSPDGQRIVSSGKDGSVRVWDPRPEPAATGPMEFTPPVYYYNFRLSADGKRAVLLEPTNRMAVLWDLEKMQMIEALDFAGTNHNRLAWSADDRRLATSDDNGDIQIWDLTARRGITNFAFPGHFAAYMEFSPNGRFLVCGVFPMGGWQRECRAWDLDEGHEVALPRQAMTNLTWCSYSPDFRLFVMLHDGGALDIWNIRTGRCVARLRQPFADSFEEGYLAFSRDGQTWASSTQNGVVALWEPTGKRPPLVVPRTTQELWHLSFCADNKRLLVSGRGSSDVARLLDVGSKRFVATLSGKPDVYWVSDMSADGNTIYAVGEKTVLLWRAPSWAEIQAAEKGKGL
jgi:eukaryotic-like serine/threonine-protein kinase